MERKQIAYKNIHIGGYVIHTNSYNVILFTNVGFFEKRMNESPPQNQKVNVA